MLGIHVARASKVLMNGRKNILDAVKDDMGTLGLNVAQIFTHGPRNYKANKIDYIRLKNYCKKNNILLIIHGSYMLPSVWNYWGKNGVNKSIENHFIDQIKTCEKLNAPLVLHLQKSKGSKTIFTIEIISWLISNYAPNVKILFEIIASKPNEETYNNPENLNNICDDLETMECRWGLCLDTAHMWALGIDLQSYDRTKQWFAKIKPKYRKRIALFHFNGEKNAKGAGKDEHAIAFSPADKIWGNVDYRNSGARFILKYAKKNHIPIVCEINEGTKKNAIASLEFIRSQL